MSSPPAQPAEKPRENENEPDPDADMEDVNNDSAPQNTSSGTLDHDFSATQPATETQPTTSTLPHHNRKDVTLREFLSKMDDYAPIVRQTGTSSLSDCTDCFFTDTGCGYSPLLNTGRVTSPKRTRSYRSVNEHNTSAAG